MNEILCESYFEKLAKENPRELSQILQTREMSFGLLARGVKCFRKSKDSDFAVSVLLPYLEHSQPMVQEGALLALEKFYSIDEQRDKIQYSLQTLLDKNLNSIIKEMILEILNDENLDNN